MRTIKKIIRSLPFMIIDIIGINISFFIGIYCKFGFDFNKSLGYISQEKTPVIIAGSLITVLCFGAMRCYNYIWKHSYNKGIIRLIYSSALSVAFYSIINISVDWFLPKTVYIIALVFFVVLTQATRYVLRLKTLASTNAKGSKFTKNKQNIMIVGAGEAGGILTGDFAKRKMLLNQTVVCFIDDDERKVGQYINDIKIVGTSKYIPEAVKKYNVNKIILAIPSMLSDDKKRILNICKTTGCDLKILPEMYQLFSGESIKVEQVRDVVIEDLLGREPICTEIDSIIKYVNGKTILVTGAGGSIGSELCRQIAKHSPKRLILFDIYENTIYDVQNELLASYSDITLTTLIGSVRDKERLDAIFKKYSPDIVYHAAAHKHVPLMEDSPNEAIKNNVFGTLNVVKMADKYKTSRFVLISTDKAVNPTNIMGASKRICEMIVQHYNSVSNTDFVAVRFGNVLGSNGSVIPLFKKQIENGGPVTVTDPRVVRYFMTIPEAVSLVLQAGEMANGGEIFVLDMGEPVKIIDLAENLIRLSGYIPYENMDIKFVGLRPGEKLYEELLMSEEGLKTTSNKLIHIGQPIKFDDKKFLERLEELRKNMENDSCNIRRLVMKIVDTYNIPDSVYEKPEITVSVTD